jgi:hypothetical protein
MTKKYGFLSLFSQLEPLKGMTEGIGELDKSSP